jgi:hypothetical protein
MPNTPAQTHPIISYQDAEQLRPRDLVHRWLEHPEDAPDQDGCLERVALAAAAAVALARDLAPSMHRALACGVELID